MAIKEDLGEKLNFEELEMLHELSEQKEQKQSEEKASGDIAFISTKEEKKQGTNSDLLDLNIAKSFDLAPAKIQIKEETNEKLNLAVNRVLFALNDITSKKTNITKIVTQLELNKVKSMLDLQGSFQGKESIKKEITSFQKELIANHEQAIHDCIARISTLESQMEYFQYQRKSLISERLSNFSWPYDEKTKIYGSNIYNLKCRIKQARMQLDDLEIQGPCSTEKDTILLTMHLKEMFIK